MKLIELTMPLDHEWMPDEVLPNSIRFFLGPKDHQEKGIVLGSDTGTCLTLPSMFSAFRKTARLDALPTEKLVLRPTAVANILKDEGEDINRTDVEKALDSVRLRTGEALLVRTGWGDRPSQERRGGSYVLRSPYFSIEAAEFLGKRMKDTQSDLLLVDTALMGWPGKYLIPEWCSLLPMPAPESAEARMYLHLYTAEKASEDFAVELTFARLGIITVRKLVYSGRIQKERFKIIVAPLKIVRGVASTCRVVAVEEEG